MVILVKIMVIIKIMVIMLKTGNNGQIIVIMLKIMVIMVKTVVIIVKIMVIMLKTGNNGQNYGNNGQNCVNIGQNHGNNGQSHCLHPLDVPQRQNILGFTPIKKPSSSSLRCTGVVRDMYIFASSCFTI